MSRILLKKLINGSDAIIVVVFFIALYIRIRHAYPILTYPDSVLYLSQAKAFLKGVSAFTFMGGEPKMLQPLFPLMTVLFSFICPTLEIAATYVSVISGSLIVFPVYYLAKSIYDKKTAYIALLFLVFDPTLINFSIIPMTEALFTLLLLTSAFLCWNIQRRKSSMYYLLIGIIIGLAYLTRVIGIILIILPLFWIIVFNVRKDIGRYIVIPSLFVLLGFFVAAIPYFASIQHNFNTWSLSGFYTGVWESLIYHNPALTYPQKIITPYDYLGKYISSVRMYLTYFPSVVSLMALIFLFLSLFKKWIHEEVLKSGFLFSWAMMFFIATTFFSPSNLENFVRYLIPIIPILFIISSNGVIVVKQHLLSFTKNRFPPKSGLIKLIYIVLVLTAFLLSNTKQYNNIRNKWKWPFEWFNQVPSTSLYQEAGKRIKKIIPPSSIIIARKPFAPYYADAIWYPISNSTSYQDIKKNMKYINNNHF